MTQQAISGGIPTEKLAQLIAKQRDKLCILTGDIIVLLDQARTLCREQANLDGFSERIRLNIQGMDELSQLQTQLNTPSLFSPRTWFDCTVTCKSLGKKGYDQLQICCDQLGEYNRMTLSFPLMEHAQKKQKWFANITQNALIIDCKSPTGTKLNQWLADYCKQHTLVLTHDQSHRLLAATEGNLSACAQEIKKLSLLATKGKIDDQVLAMSLSDNMQFTVFQLIDHALGNQIEKGCQMLNSLHQKGVSPVLILWSFVRELRTLIKIKMDALKRKPWDSIMRQHRIWSSKQNLVQQTLNKHTIQQLLNLLEHASQIELMIKGLKPGIAEQHIDRLFFQLAGHDMPLLTQKT